MTTAPAARATDAPLAALLANRRWERRRRPFPHVVATNVFTADACDALAAAFRAELARAGAGYLARHDLHGITLTSDAGPLGVFASRAWHDLLARLFGVEATGDVSVGLHHHEAGSASGFPHTDLNSAWFPADVGEAPVRLARPDEIEYTTGRAMRPGARGREVVRAVACLFYVNNPGWRPGDGGATGLYASAGDPPTRPVAVVPPVDNSLLAFECTPFSYHGFIGNRVNPRDSVVMWLHRDRTDADRRWGAQSIVPFGGEE